MCNEEIAIPQNHRVEIKLDAADNHAKDARISEVCAKCYGKLVDAIHGLSLRQATKYSRKKRED
jgi:hypothetical protein